MGTWLTILLGALSWEVLASHSRRRRYRTFEKKDGQASSLQSLTTSRWWDLPSNNSSSGTAENPKVLDSTRQNRKFDKTRISGSSKVSSLEDFCTGARKSFLYRRDVIVYLGQKTHSSYDATHKNTLNASMESLRNNMRFVHQSDVIVWHEGDLTPEDATALDGVTNVRFCLLTVATGWGPPPWLPIVPTMKFSPGYRFMIRFYAITIWSTLERLGYEWVMRMDDDSFVLSPIDYNIFRDMRQKGLYYGYRTLSRECPVIFGDFVDAFTRHAHWLGDQNIDHSEERGALDYGPNGLIGLARRRQSPKASSSSTKLDGVLGSSVDTLDAEMRQITKFCNNWPRHCRKAEMQASLAAASNKVNPLSTNGRDHSTLRPSLVHEKRWRTWYCSGPGQLGYYNNWFVTNVTWWSKNQQVSRMIRAFDRSNLIFSRRCNDLVFQTAIIKLFMPIYRRKRYIDFTYQHHTISSGEITFGGIETGYLDHNPAGNLKRYREKHLRPRSGDSFKVRICHVQAVVDGPLHKTYYISPAADIYEKDLDRMATTNMLRNRFESPYCGPGSKMPLE